MNAHTSSCDLQDANGAHLCACPLGPLQAWERVRSHHTSAAKTLLSADRSAIWVTFPRSDVRYSYLLRPTAALPEAVSA
ncbi:MAG: hypothetical protein ABR532_05845 [Candidatus Dormibacteria bacterium]